MASKQSIPTEQRRFGAHVSIAGGLHLAFERGAELGCDAIQVFVKNQRQWKAKPLTAEEIKLWNEARDKTMIKPVIAHDSYLINLCATDDAAWQKSIDAFIDELDRCERLGIAGLVTPSKVVAVALNTSLYPSDEDARAVIESIAVEAGLPADDPVRFGADRLWPAVRDAVDALPWV